jgi:hypothetical protein
MMAQMGKQGGPSDADEDAQEGGADEDDSDDDGPPPLEEADAK